LVKAWQRVKANRGSAGVDGLSANATGEYLKRAGPRIKEDLQAGRYRPAPVRRVQIPKPQGGIRELVIPTVTDSRTGRMVAASPACFAAQALATGTDDLS
jgi:retron-type reverse transcriptase